MSDTSNPLGSLFETQRTLIDRSIETQEKLNRQGLDLTRQAVTPLVDAAPGTGEDAEDRLEDAFEQLEEGQADLFEDVQEAAEAGVDTSEDVAEWSVELVEDGVDRLREVGERVEETETEAEELLETAVEAEGEALADIEGIGKTYQERLADAGIRTRTEMARTSAADVAEAAGVSEDRAGDWIQRAQDRG